MKFLKITTNEKQDYINLLILNMSNIEVNMINDLYKKINLVEFTNEIGFESMFIICDEIILNNLEKIFKKYGIGYEIEDLTKDVIFDYNFKIDFLNEFDKPVEYDIIKLIKKYKIEFVTKDNILDKIIERGIESLTDFDLDVLNS